MTTHDLAKAQGRLPRRRPLLLRFGRDPGPRTLALRQFAPTLHVFLAEHALGLVLVVRPHSRRRFSGVLLPPSASGWM
jgi:hypothetical protein